MTLGFFVVGEHFCVIVSLTLKVLFFAAIIAIGGQIDRGRLYCREDNLIESIKVPTLFCILEG